MKNSQQPLQTSQQIDAAQAGDLKDKVDVLAYSNLVKRIATQLHSKMPSSVQLEDLVQSGIIGLMDALSKFDDSKGASFETYASIRIKGAIIDEIRKFDWAPRSVHKNSRMISQAMRAVENREGRDAKDTEIAAELEVSLGDYHQMCRDLSGIKLYNISELSSTSTPADLYETGNFDHAEKNHNGGNNKFLGSSSEPHKCFENDQSLALVAEIIDQLPKREKQILSLYYTEELNLKEIGQILSLSESRVSQILSQAVVRIKSKIE